MDKADFEEMKDMEFYRDMIEDAGKDKKIVADMLEDPELSGIDLNEYMYFFATHLRRIAAINPSVVSSVDWRMQRNLKL